MRQTSQVRDNISASEKLTKGLGRLNKRSHQMHPYLFSLHTGLAKLPILNVPDKNSTSILHLHSPPPPHNPSSNPFICHKSEWMPPWARHLHTKWLSVILPVHLNTLWTHNQHSPQQACLECNYQISLNLKQDNTFSWVVASGFSLWWIEYKL